MNCACCGAGLCPALRTSRLALQRCRGCGTYWAEHGVRVNVAEPWHFAEVTPRFLEALSERRAVQSRHIVDRFRDTLGAGDILDYGCGQGVFVSALAAQGFRAVGCDVSRVVTAGIDPHRFIRLDEPWSIPAGCDFTTVILFDVLEHSPDPAGFIGRLREHGAAHLLVKVPLASGPLFMIARMMARIGYEEIIEKLFLVGEAAPHTSYFTSEGLSRLLANAGFRLAGSLRLAEVGRELPCRIRELPPSWRLVRPVLSGLGWLAEYLSPLWPDTSVFLFDR